MHYNEEKCYTAEHTKHNAILDKILSVAVEFVVVCVKIMSCYFSGSCGTLHFGVCTINVFDGCNFWQIRG